MNVLENENSESFFFIQMICKAQEDKQAGLIISHHQQINIADSKGNMPIHWAAKLGETKIVELLIRYGANPNTKNNEGKIAADLTIKKNIKKLLSNTQISSTVKHIKTKALTSAGQRWSMDANMEDEIRKYNDVTNNNNTNNNNAINSTNSIKKEKRLFDPKKFSMLFTSNKTRNLPPSSAPLSPNSGCNHYSQKSIEPEIKSIKFVDDQIKYANQNKTNINGNLTKHSTSSDENLNYTSDDENLKSPTKGWVQGSVAPPNNFDGKSMREIWLDKKLQFSNTPSFHTNSTNISSSLLPSGLLVPLTTKPRTSILLPLSF
eukprot:TRINITY_DN1650_c0_g1_i4.p1 TRINITY_DN1650_c0_g1~~TRINITY_DN1650_c0_g1_i4.p1  ORF type:complete len:319 (-),score=139.43 TRINITY_DN1650_c0_g1_i4:140-1096(-)